MFSIENVVWQDRSVRIYIDAGRIDQLEDLGPAKSNMLQIVPGMVDLHVHSRQPGGDQKEDWEHLFQAAMMGGVTTVVTMPNTSPPIISLEVLQLARDLARNSPLKPLFWFGATPDNAAEIRKAIAEPDVVGIKMFMGSSTGDLLVAEERQQLEVFRLGAKLGAIVAVHAEDEAMIQSQIRAYGKNASLAQHDLIRHQATEINAVSTALALAKKASCQLYVCHVSCPKSASMVIEAQKKGQLAWLEVTPHHLFLDRNRLKTQRAAFFKMNPPLRHFSAGEELRRLLLADQLDTVGSDHAPHTTAEKSASDYHQIPSGVPGLQTSLPLLVDQVLWGKMNWELLVKYTSARPAEIIGLENKGRIEAGTDADLVLIDPSQETTITDKMTAHKCGWTPFAGKVTKGRVVATILGGEFQYDIR